MSVIVQKFGGSSVGDIERIKHVAEKVKATRDQGHQVVVVLSAMSGRTDDLVKKASAFTDGKPHFREYDVLLATGEQETIALLAMCLNHMDCPARSYLGYQIPIITSDASSKARIQSIETTHIQKELDEGYVVVVVGGFQGKTEKGDITTLGTWWLRYYCRRCCCCVKSR